MTFLIMMRHSFAIAWPFLTSICFIFLITLAIYPGTTCDTNLSFLADLDPASILAWQYLIFVTIFNIFDTIGRWAGGQPWAMIGDNWTFIGTYARVIFVVSSLLIVYDVSPTWLFGSGADWFKIFNMATCALTNGYYSTLLAIKSPSRAPDDSKEQIGIFVGIFLTLGIVIGSIISIFLGDIIPKN